MFPVFPVPALADGRLPQITSGYGPRTGGMYDFHYGVDILYPRKNEPIALPVTSSSGNWSMPDGIPALAAAPGIVTKSSWTNTGDRVRIDHGGGWESGYFHLRNRKVNVGDRVEAGQVLGTISFNPWVEGKTSAPPPAPPNKVSLNHLHAEIYHNGQTVNPAPLLLQAKRLPVPNNYDWLIYAGGAVVLGLLAAKHLR